MLIYAILYLFQVILKYLKFYAILHFFLNNACLVQHLAVKKKRLLSFSKYSKFKFFCLNRIFVYFFIWKKVYELPSFIELTV